MVSIVAIGGRDYHVDVGFGKYDPLLISSLPL